MTPLQVGVCSWSINRHDVRAAIETAKRELGLSLVQAGFFGEGIPSEGEVPVLAEWIRGCGVEVSATCAGFVGEDYTSIASIRATGGYAADEFFDERFEATCRMRDLTAAIGATLFTVHVGHVPTDATGAKYKALLDRVGRVADALGEKGVTLAMETGQESGETMAGFVADLGRENAKISFDPGNLILYGSGDPVEAVSKLRGQVAQVHIKDATASSRPGEEWGTEVPAGSGEAEVPRVISKLRAGGYVGALIMERELGRAGSLNDLRETMEFLETMGLS